MASWIVLVDDDVNNLKLVGHVLSKNNIRVTALRSGKALLDYMQENRPDMILLDIKMPEMDGFETLEKLRELEKNRGIEETPVVFLTSDEDSNSLARAFEMGISDYICKPIIPTLLLRRLDSILTIQKHVSVIREDSHDVDLSELSRILSEKKDGGSALILDQDAFIHVYRFTMRYLERYKHNACKLLLTLSPSAEISEEKYWEYCEVFQDFAGKNLRKSDLVMQFRRNQFFVFLTDVREDSVIQVLSGLLHAWDEAYGNILTITYEVEYIGNDRTNRQEDETLWVAIVDDDMQTLRMAGNTLSKKNIRVSALRSGKALLEFLKDNRPDLILLDVLMPEMNGFEVMKQLKSKEAEVAEIPVIFLTGEESEEAEVKGLGLGAVDFIKKPFTPDALSLRIRQIASLVRLQKDLAAAVDRKTRDNESLLIHLVQALAGAIDAKDKYTKGHSGRVAEYSKEIAKRYGYSEKEQEEIYMMALLHDVGKIGVPNEVINKPTRLTEEEFEKIKVHPGIGARILGNITEMPRLSYGAHWHHERYGGGGYPDGLKGLEIPEEARIIAVADAYDAMTSYRSYRPAMTQEHVRDELQKGKGEQFDPRFAEIMIKMMDEDTEFDMREHKVEE